MIKFDVLNRWTGKVQFTAEIDCDDSEIMGVKLRLAILWAVDNNVSLNNASLDGASLDGVILDGASLNRANLDGASLNRASLNRANLDGANLNHASLNNANLNRANLNHASLDGASLNNASLWSTCGNNREIKTYQCGNYIVNTFEKRLQIGCENHTTKQWFKFSNAQISKMDRGALEWWTVWKPVLKQIIEANEVAK